MKKNSRKTLGIILLVLAIGCIAYVVYHVTVKSANENIYAKVQKQAVDESKKKKVGPVYISPIDFEELKKMNPDIYAWIEIPGTQINYPIVQSPTDDVYYLNHTIDGKEGYPGSIYTESLNSRDFSDYNTVIYGHNMRDGSMFKGLHEYEDDQYMKDHAEVIIYTPEKKLTYRVFAAIRYGDEHIVNCYDFTNPEQRQLYLDTVYGSRDMKNSFDDSVEVTADDRLLTLSTCIAGQPDKRFIVEAVLTDE